MYAKNVSMLLLILWLVFSFAPTFTQSTETEDEETMEENQTKPDWQLQLEEELLFNVKKVVLERLDSSEAPQLPPLSNEERERLRLLGEQQQQQQLEERETESRHRRELKRDKIEREEKEEKEYTVAISGHLHKSVLFRGKDQLPEHCQLVYQFRPDLRPFIPVEGGTNTSSETQTGLATTTKRHYSVTKATLQLGTELLQDSAKLRLEAKQHKTESSRKPRELLLTELSATSIDVGQFMTQILPRGARRHLRFDLHISLRGHVGTGVPETECAATNFLYPPPIVRIGVKETKILQRNRRSTAPEHQRRANTVRDCTEVWGGSFPRANGLTAEQHNVLFDCCRHTYTARFNDTVWSNLVVAPTEFQHAVCIGRCSSFKGSGSKHTFNYDMYLQMMERLKGPDGKPMKAPCCQPISFEGITVTARTESSSNQVATMTIPEFRVTDCGCG